MSTINDRPPNFRGADGELFLVRCFHCDPVRGRENWAPVVTTGECAWCGWTEDDEDDEPIFKGGDRNE